MKLIDKITNYDKIFIIYYDNLESRIYYNFLRSLISYQLNINKIKYTDLSQLDWFDDHNKAIKRHIKKTNDIYLFPIYKIDHLQFNKIDYKTFIKANKFILYTETYSISTAFLDYDYQIVQKSDLVLHIHNDRLKILKDKYGFDHNTEILLSYEYKLVNRLRKIRKIQKNICSI